MLLLEEKLINRMFLGVFLVAFGGTIFWLLSLEATRTSIFGRSVGIMIGTASVLVGVASILRRGFIRVDQTARCIEFLGGFQKFRVAPRVVSFDDVTALTIRTMASRHTSYAVDVVVEEGSDIVLDQTSSSEYANSLGEEVAGRVGCELRGRVP